jgi:hypothetical protein
VIGQRIIMTADQENVKAILATQFDDFGKGEKFREDWVDMLGHSMLGFSRITIYSTNHGIYIFSVC